MRGKVLRVSPELIVGMCIPERGAGWAVDCFGLPADAKVESVDVSGPPTVISIVVSSDAWPELADGQYPPLLEHEPMFRTIEVTA
jgi:hypothetical protein